MKGKILRIRNKTIILGLVIFFIFCFQFTVFSKTESNENISMSISYGYGNIAKGGRYLPIHVFYGNFSSKSFQGKVSIEFTEADNRKYSYEYPVSLEGKQSLLSNYYVKMSNEVDTAIITLKNEKEQTVVEKTIFLDIKENQSKIMVGILSDTQKKLDYFNNVAINYGLINLNTVSLAAGSFPELYSGLEQLDIIIISNFRIRDLSNKQSRALMDWVKQGGVLLMGTGARADDTIGRYAPELLEDVYESPNVKTLNFEINNEKKQVDLFSVLINLHGGNVLLYDGDFPLINSVNKEKGLIAVAGFDFCDLDKFANTNTQFSRYIITSVLGSERIEGFSKQGKIADNKFQNIEPILNSVETKKLPPMAVYTLILFAYIILVGPAMFIYLREHDLAIYYRKCVLLSSFLFLAVIIIYNGRTRFTSTFYNYITVYDASESDVSETTYVNLRNPYNKPYSVVVDSNYSVLPIISNEIKKEERKTLSKNTTVNIDNEEFTKNISIKQIGAFSSSILKLDKTIENLNSEGFTGDINFFDEKLSISITNNYDYKVKNATLLLYGKIALLGDFEAGETKDIENCHLINIPLTNFDLTAKIITGMEKEKGNNTEEMKKNDISAYMQMLNISNFVSFYLKENDNGYTADAKVLAFSETALSNPIFYNETMESDGLTLLTSVIHVNSGDNGKIYRQSLLKMPLELSGNYSYLDNALTGSEATVLEYFLGDDINIEKVNFEHISDAFVNSRYSDSVKIFNGNIALYNFKTGNFDYVSKDNFSLLELLPYLSDENTIRVRYSNIEEGDLEKALPMISIIGESK